MRHSNVLLLAWHTILSVLSTFSSAHRFTLGSKHAHPPLDIPKPIVRSITFASHSPLHAAGEHTTKEKPDTMSGTHSLDQSMDTGALSGDSDGEAWMFEKPLDKPFDLDEFKTKEMESGNYDSLSDFVVQHSTGSLASKNARPSTANTHAAVFPPPSAPRNNRSAPASLFGSIEMFPCETCGYTDTDVVSCQECGADPKRRLSA